MLTSKPVTKEFLEDLLAHSVDASGLHDILTTGTGVTSSGNAGTYLGFPINNRWDLNAYFDITDPNDPDYIDAASVFDGVYLERWKLIIDALCELKPKMISLAFFWGVYDWPALINRMRITIATLKCRMPEVVIQGGPNEFLHPSILSNNAQAVGYIPKWVFDAFNLPFVKRTFSWSDIAFNDWKTNRKHNWHSDPNPYSQPADGAPIVPNISKQEAQMWMYFLGRMYIDIGCECLNFAQVNRMNNEDENNGSNWNIVFQKLRAYADSLPPSTNPVRNIRFLLITAHNNGMKLPDTDQLIFDFHTAPVRPSEYGNYTGGQFNPNGGSTIIALLPDCNKIYQKSKGGQTPSGWWCVHNPYQVFIDNYADDDGVSGGQSSNSYSIETFGGQATVTIEDGSKCGHYSWDEISWFAMQSKKYRDEWLKYAYYQVRCLDPNGFLFLPFMRNIVIAKGKSIRYVAMNPNPPYFNPIPLESPGVPDRDYMPDKFWGGWGQMAVLKDILNGVYEPAFGWVGHNFSKEDVFTKTEIINSVSNLIFVGEDKAYYIGTDGRIHGFVNNGSVWMPVSPSHASASWQTSTNPISLNNQPFAQGSLVASPDGTRLLYIAVNGFIYGYDIINIWTYNFAYFMLQPMIDHHLRAYGSLIYPTNDRVYYIAKHIDQQAEPTRVHGFIRTNGVWGSVSPAYIADILYGQSVLTVQPQARGKLMYRGDRLYYRDIYGFLRFYNIYGDHNYWYNDFAGANMQLLSQSLRMVGDYDVHDNRIYYVAVELNNNFRRSIHCIVEGSNSIYTVSPTWSAALYGYQAPVPVQAQAQPMFELAISPDGKMIVFNDENGVVHYYEDPDNTGWNFRYRVMAGQAFIKNSIQFRGSNTIIGILSAKSFYQNAGEALIYGRVYYLKWQRNYCQTEAKKAIMQRHTLL